MILTIYAHPNAKRSAVISRPDGSCDVFVSSPAHDNQANKAIMRLLADHLNVPISLLSIRRGVNSRRKLIEVDTE